MRWIVVITLALLLACSSDKSDSDTTTAMRSMSDDSLCTLAAQRVIHEFKRELKGALMTAMKDGGPAAAIGACNTQAPEIAVKHAEPGIFSIRRVTDRNRNPKNLADSVELEILAAFADSTTTAVTFQSAWRDDGDNQKFLFYQPIFVGPGCMGCHGPVETLKAEVREGLRLSYPDDKAVGYHSGDLRGMFVVGITWPRGRNWAEKVIAED